MRLDRLPGSCRLFPGFNSFCRHSPSWTGGVWIPCAINDFFAVKRQDCIAVKLSAIQPEAWCRRSPRPHCWCGWPARSCASRMRYGRSSGASRRRRWASSTRRPAPEESTGRSTGRGPTRFGFGAIPTFLIIPIDGICAYVW